MVVPSLRHRPVGQETIYPPVARGWKKAQQSADRPYRGRSGRMRGTANMDLWTIRRLQMKVKRVHSRQREEMFDNVKS